MGYVYNPLLTAGLDLAGLAGAAGPPGADGTSFVIRGSVADEEALDDIEDPADGDAYLTLDTSDIYIWTGTEWLNLGQLQGPPGDTGAAGADGRTILGGSSGAPSSGDGENGDYWIQITEGDVLLYGPKASGSWPAGISLIGPQGEPGEPGAAALDDLTDVEITTPADGDVLKYDSVAGGWVNDTIAGGGATELDDLSDVVITTPAQGEVLVYDTVAGAFVNDTIAGGSATPAGDAGEIQINDGEDPAGLGAVAGFAYDVDTDVLSVPGDISLDDGGSFTTTLQVVTPTENRTISLPNATGTVALVSGSSGQVAYNNAGAMAGVTNSSVDGSGNVTLGTRFISSLNGALSATGIAGVPVAATGTWITGGTATTCKPHVLIEPAGTTSTAWSTNGTGLGVNAASGFAGNLLDLQVNGSQILGFNQNGLTLRNTNANAFISYERTTGPGRFELRYSSTARILYDSSRVYLTETEGFSTAFNAAGSNFSISGGRANANSGSYAGGNLILNGGLPYGGGANGDIVIGGARGNLQITDARDIILGTTTGTKIGTATTQKLAFFNAAPVVQPSAVADLTTTFTANPVTADGSVTIADGNAPTVAEVLEYCVELEAKLEAALSRLRDLGLIAT